MFKESILVVSETLADLVASYFHEVPEMTCIASLSPLAMVQIEENADSDMDEQEHSESSESFSEHIVYSI